MGKRGPKPKPTALKIITGNPGKRPLNELEPKPKAGTPRMPAWMSTEAKAEWKRIVPRLAEIGMLSLVDGAALVGYCEAWSEFVQAKRDIEKHGTTILVGENGTMQTSPWVAQARESRKAMLQFMQHFGLTPSARASLKIEGDSKPKSEITEFLTKRKRG